MAINKDQEMWVWKLEPVSPSGTSQLEVDDDWLAIDKNTSEFANNATEPVMYDDQPTRAQVATKLLEELDEWIKEEPFSEWLEEKIDLPILDELTTEECEANKLAFPAIVKAQQPESTQTLLQEFESVLGDVGACHQVLQSPQVISSTLTPPQSPPPPNNRINIDTQLLVTLQPVQPLYPVQQVAYNTIIPNEKNFFMGQLVTDKQLTIQDKPMYVDQLATTGPWNIVNEQLNHLSGDVSNDLDVVDEFVRACTEDIAPPSPCVSTGDSSASSEDSTDDPDWILDSSDSGSGSKRADYQGQSRKRHKPYSRPSVEDKKVRKKEQNKNAATRYRQKKKQEIKEIIGEERELTDHNELLQNKVNDLQREIGYLKGLMRDLFKAKGLMK